MLVSREKVPVLEAEPGLVVTRHTPADAFREASLGQATGDDGGPQSRGRPAVAVGIVAAVIITAAAGVWPIYIAALAGVVALVLTGCLTTSAAYAAVSWDIYFLLAGILPLGSALERTGAAAFLAELVLARAESMPPVIVLGLFYLLTALLTNVISNNAAVVLMIPVAVDAALQIGAEPFSFLLAVTFGASTAFMTPVGYQTSLLVYTPGGYHFQDYVVAGAPLQLLLAVVTPAGIALLWGI